MIEMMVTLTVMVVVLLALYSVFDMSVRVFSFGNDKVEAAENARLGLEKMGREIRAAYPYDKGDPATPDPRLFAGTETARVTFGNDLGGGDRRVDAATEEITYSLSPAGPPYTLLRTVGSGSPQPVVEFIGEFDDGAPGLEFEYLRPSGTDLVAASAEGEIEVVRVTLLVDKDGREQRLSTDVYLRNRG